MKNYHNTAYIISEIKIKFCIRVELKRPKKINDLRDLSKEFSQFLKKKKKKIKRHS